MSEPADISLRDRTLSDSSAHSDIDAEPEFKPVIKLPEVKVATNEENETVLFKVRARLYRFDTSNEDGPEWKERGTGELKLLRHKENNRVRLVMRRDKTLKVCANHFITSWMELKPSIGSDKAFVYTVAADFADEEAKRECLAVKFGTVDAANLFKEKFNEAREIILAKCKQYANNESSNNEEKERICSKSDSEKEEKIGKVTEQLSDLDVSKDK